MVVSLFISLSVIGLLLGAYCLILALCKAACKPTPKPGKDFDERGLY
ncbi:Uncharacterised protein [uncultured archaeon]|nr:Uncharacterised protein [uncultured archaeon]